MVVIGEGGWCSKIVTGAHGSCLWKLIMKGWEQVSGFIRYEVGFGTMVRYWHDWWSGERALKEKFSRLYRLADKKDAAVADLLSWRGAQFQWNIP